jgi:hypothetical protein
MNHAVNHMAVTYPTVGDGDFKLTIVIRRATKESTNNELYGL